MCQLMGSVWTVSNGHLKSGASAQIPTVRHLAHMPPLNANIVAVSSAQLVHPCLGRAARIQMDIALCQTCQEIGDPNPRWGQGSPRKRKGPPGSVSSAP